MMNAFYYSLPAFVCVAFAIVLVIADQIVRKIQKKSKAA